MTVKVYRMDPVSLLEKAYAYYLYNIKQCQAFYYKKKMHR